MTTRKSISITLKILIIATSLGGVLLSLFTATKDGYSHWARRLLYFTAQSNIWIGVVTLFILLFSFTPYREKRTRILYTLRFVFTVSITMTALVFCGLLAPFAKQYDFSVYTLSSLFTHVLSPLFAIADFFVDKQPFPLTKRHVFLSALPPIIYFTVSFILEYFNVDFGKGTPYPYFFMNFRSPAGVFGFTATPPFIIGTFYWFLFFPSILFAVAFLYRFLYNKKGLG